MSSNTQEQIPAHVPEHLVSDVVLEDLPGGVKDPHKAITSLQDGPDIVWAPKGRRGRPHWIVTRHKQIVDMLQDADTFSSEGSAAFSQLLGETWDLIPVELDGDIHKKFRSLLNPLFSPKRINEIGDKVFATAEKLVDEILEKGESEFIEEFSKPFPVIVFLELFGLPIKEMPRFLDWEEKLLHSKEMEERVVAARNIKEYLLDEITKRRSNPSEDLISFAVQAEVDGRPLSDEEILGICFMLFVGGLDTVASALSFIFKFLAENPDYQAELRAKPEEIPAAVEELLRAHGIVVPLRVVTKDTNFHGVEMKVGDRVVAPLALSGLDDREFKCPHAVDFHRDANRHISFSSGPHRCIGSHLARRELKIALELWLSRIPPFRIKPGEEPVTHTTAIFAVDYLPLVWD